MTEAELLQSIGAHVAGTVVRPETLPQLDGSRGAYVLLAHLAVPVAFTRRAIACRSLHGWLIYVGSARGAGGIRARLGHHFAAAKPVRWHIDAVTNIANMMAAIAVIDGIECALVERLLDSGTFETALPGFGSTDCRRCEGHLLRPRQHAAAARISTISMPDELQSGDGAAI